ncbi:uncharacterized protein LOC134196995 [Corticium candelabrum]|uniref:uncharacterized protein LOC134196995 n=1 Tax=Corticium candelabrum TaxID=121492 RepID=UPI002E2577DD|nr:uncharacterized protein LOC134196995 [Corticium candelabrum]
MASNKLLTGNHWVVAVIDVCTETTYYCDPLGFPIPINLSVETQPVSLELKRVLSKQMKMFYHTIAMHKPMFGPNGEHICSQNCLNFPVQKCSSACGIIAFTFVTISAFTPTNVWECICSPHMALNDVKSKLTLFWQASKYSPYLRKVLACWISTQTIDVTNIIDKSALVPTASSFQASRLRLRLRLRLSLKQKDCKTEEDSFCHKNAPCDEGTENSNERSPSTTHLDISSVTAPQLTTGQEFSSFEELKHCISSYERATFVQLDIRRSRSLESAKKRATKKNFNSDLRFSELQYNCIHGGKHFQSRGTGKRPNHS